MARLHCTLISLGATGARFGLGVSRASLNLAMLPVTAIGDGVKAVHTKGNEVLQQADRAIENIGRKCGL